MMMDRQCVRRDGVHEIRVLRPTGFELVRMLDEDEGLHALIERWRLQAFDVYAAIRHAQRDEARSDVARLVDLRRASDLAQTLVDEIAALRVAAQVDLRDDVNYGLAI
jgi:hypothetical protein